MLLYRLPAPYISRLIPSPTSSFGGRVIEYPDGSQFHAFLQRSMLILLMMLHLPYRQRLLEAATAQAFNVLRGPIPRLRVVAKLKD